jgi:hypothetical protein
MRVKNKFSLIALILLFLGPLFGAWYLYTTEKGEPKKMVHHGTLLQPPLDFAQLPITDTASGQALAAKQFRGKWLIVYITALPCKKECQQVLYKIRQVRLTLGKDQRRVQRVILTPIEQSLGELPIVLQKEYAGTASWQMKLNKQQQLSEGHLYLVDPLGNVFMRYPQDVAPRALKDDLVRLLKVSRIG